MYFTKIDWAPSETLFKIGSFGIHYYSLMFIIAFGLGYYIMKKIFIEEKISLDYLESLFVYMVLSILLGARLGDVFFYSWDYYQNHLLETLLPIRDTPNGYFVSQLIGGEYISPDSLISPSARKKRRARGLR